MNILDSKPWNLRNPSFEEERRYFNLIDLHKLTQAWLHEINPADAANTTHRLERVIRPELAQNLWLLEKVKLDQLPPELSKMIDSQSVTEFLNELEETIFIVQSTTLENTLDHTTDHIGMMNLLEKVSWKYGRALAERRWPQFNETHSDEPQKFFQTLMDSPLWTQKHPGDLPFLLERVTSELCSFYWLHSPHATPSLRISARVMELCQLYHEMIRGFFYGLSRSLKVEIIPTLLNGQKVYHITLHR
jgi:hypothetical protein